MIDVNVSIVTEMDGQADRWTGEQDHVLSQADALTKKSTLDILHYHSKLLDNYQFCLLQLLATLAQQQQQQTRNQEGFTLCN